MAAFTSAKSGNWSDPATWYAGSVTDIIDNGSATFVGTWLTGGTTGYNANWRYAPAGTGTKTATWSWTGLTAGVAKTVVYTWPEQPNRATNTKWWIFDSDGSTELASGTINQVLAPAGYSAGGRPWSALAEVTPSGTTLSLRINDNANNNVIADAAGFGAAPAETTVPGAGDTATVSQAVVMDSSVTLGTSPSDSTTMVLTLSGSGTLTVSTGATLTLRGNAVQSTAGTDVTFQAGSFLEFDASLATTTTTNYVWDVKGVSSGNSPRFICQGTSGSKVTISSNAGGGNGRFAGTSGHGDNEGFHQWEHVNATRIGTASLNATYSRPATTAFDVYFRNCTFDACGPVALQQNTAARSVEISDCTFTNALANAVTWIASTSNAPTGTNLLTGNTSDGLVSLYGYQQAVTGNVFTAGFTCLTNFGLASCENNFIRLTGIGDNHGGGQGSIPCNVVDNWIYVGNNVDAVNNPHWIKIDRYTADPATESIFDGNVFESDGADGQGDIIYQYVNTRNLIARNNLVIPDLTTGLGPGTLMTTGAASSGATGLIYCEHNTHFGGYQSLLVLNENSQGKTGVVASFKSNIGWNNPALNGGLGMWLANDVISGNSGPSNMFAPADASHNASYGLRGGGTSTLDKYYRLNLSDYTAVGANDVRDTDPQFVDSTRNVATWGRSLGLTGTDREVALAAWDEMISRTAGFTTAAYLAYVREGFRPTNESLRGAGHDGEDIGAVAMADTFQPAWARGSNVLVGGFVC